MASFTSIVKTADLILSRPTLSKIITPVAKTFAPMLDTEKWD